MYDDSDHAKPNQNIEGKLVIDRAKPNQPLDEIAIK